MSGLELIAVLPGVVNALINGYNLYLKYKEKRGRKTDPDSRFGISLLAGQKVLEQSYNRLATRLGRRFTKGDAQVCNDFEAINRRIERVVVAQLEQRLDALKALGRNGQVAGEAEEHWEKERDEALQEQIKRGQASLEAFVNRTWHAPSSTLLGPNLRLSVVPRLPYSNIYCDGALRLQHNPTADFIDISVSYDPAQGGICKDCYLEIRDVELPPKEWRLNQWTKLARCHIKASMSRTDRRAWFRCPICADVREERLILSARNFLKHLLWHERSGKRRGGSDWSARLSVSTMGSPATPMSSATTLVN